MYLTPLTLHDDLYEFMCNLCIAEIQGPEDIFLPLTVRAYELYFATVGSQTIK